MRHFNDDDEITIEPFRATGFPVLRDLVVDRGAFDRIIQAGGYTGVRVGSAPEANARASPRRTPTWRWTRRSASAAAPASPPAPMPPRRCSPRQRSRIWRCLPQGQAENDNRVRNMVAQMDAEGFGHCTNHGECERACPKEISLRFIAMMNRELLAATATAKASLPTRSRGESKA